MGGGEAGASQRALGLGSFETARAEAPESVGPPGQEKMRGGERVARKRWTGTLEEGMRLPGAGELVFPRPSRQRG